MPDAKPSHIVAIGASAGGLEALTEFFDHLPPTQGLAFVVIQHLSPDHKSFMVDLLQKHTRLAVLEAAEGMRVEAGKVYHIPPGTILTIADGVLHSEPKRDRRNFQLPIDLFFRSLAEDGGIPAIAIILSGTGSDGTAGIRAIKEAGGAIMVQDPSTAKFDGMPRSALSTGLVDFVLRPGDMPDRMFKFLHHPRINLTPEESEELPTPKANEPLQRIAQILVQHTGIDFSGYKASTLIRRLERRMGVRHCASLEDYIELLEEEPQEATTLRKELLIGVTQFFRDVEAWDFLKREVIPSIASLNQSNREIRAWVAGCATGEEAYSLAILLQEHIAASGQHYRIKIFATDLDQQSIDFASTGLYPLNIANDVGRDRLNRYFIKHADGFQVIPALREMVVFAPHDLIRDPPFTRMDITTCRNLLIYLQPEVQERVISLLHFSLKPHGYLFLGSSESPGKVGEQLQTVNGRWRIYQGSGVRRHTIGGPGSIRLDGAPRWRMPEVTPRPRTASTYDGILERVHQELIRDLDLRCLIVDSDGHLIHSFGDVGEYLHMGAGPVDTRIGRLLAPRLAESVDGGLQVARRDGTEVEIPTIGLDGGRSVRVRIKPIRGVGSQDRSFVVFLLPTEEDGQAQPLPAVQLQDEEASKQRVAYLEERLIQSESNLQSTLEELETSNEELQATNEELVSANEELQSTNEELQSLNEELYTVNSELQLKVAEVTQAHNDMNNLLVASKTATLFLEQSLDVRRFTPAAGQLLNLLDRDVGRPFAHIATPLQGADLLALAAEVAMSGRGTHCEARHADGRIFGIDVLPYRTDRGNDDGVVITFSDVTTIRGKVDELAASEERYRHFFEQIANGLAITYGDDLRISYAAGPALAEFGADRLLNTELVGGLLQTGDAEIRRQLQSVFEGSACTFTTRRRGRDILVTALPIVDQKGHVSTAVAILQDVTSLRGDATPASARPGTR